MKFGLKDIIALLKGLGIKNLGKLVLNAKTVLAIVTAVKAIVDKVAPLFKKEKGCVVQDPKQPK